MVLFQAIIRKGWLSLSGECSQRRQSLGGLGRVSGCWLVCGAAAMATSDASKHENKSRTIVNGRGLVVRGVGRRVKSGCLVCRFYIIFVTRTDGPDGVELMFCS